MKKTILLIIVLIYANQCFAFDNFRESGKLSTSGLGGYARDVTFYNDTCYILTGSGKILVTDTSGKQLANYFSSYIFNIPSNLYVDDKYVIVLDYGYIHFFDKKGKLIKKTTTVGSFDYIWATNKTEILAVGYDAVTVYNYNTGSYVKKVSPANTTFGGDYFIGYKDRLYEVNYRTLRYYEWIDGYIRYTDLATLKYKTHKDNRLYLACIKDDYTVWFNYLERDRLYYMDKNFNIVDEVHMPFVKKPDEEQIYTESGFPFLKVFYVQGTMFVVNIGYNYIDYYSLVTPIPMPRPEPDI